MDIKIDGEAVSAVVQQAIMAQLDDHAREMLIAAALEHLLKDRTSGDGYRAIQLPSVLQQAFNQAIEVVCRKVVAEHVEANPNIRERVNARVGEAILAMEEAGEYTGVSTAVAAALVDVIVKKRQYD